MEITATRIADVVVLKLNGDFKTKKYIVEIFWAHFNRGLNKFILNFEKVRAINSVGLQALIDLHRLAESAGGGIRLSGICRDVLRVLESAEVDQVLVIQDDEDLALADLLSRIPLDLRSAPVSRYRN